MIRPPHPAPALLAAVLASLPVLAPANTVLTMASPDGAELTVRFPYSQMPRWGYVPLQVELRAPVTGGASWNLQSTNDQYRVQDNAPSISRTFRLAVAAGETASYSLLVPAGQARPNQYHYGGDALALTATRNEGPREVGYGTVDMDRSGESNPFINLVSADFDHKARLDPGWEVPWQTGIRPEDWRAFTAGDRVGLTVAEWTSSPPGTRRALLHWARFGGHLLIAGPPGAAPAGLGLEPDTLSRDFSLGQVTYIETQDKRIRVDPGEASSPLHDALYGSLGHEWTVARKEFLRANSGATTPLLILVLIAFIVAVGPVNLFLLAPSKRRHRLFATTPLISLGACGLLFIAIILADGIGGKGRRSIHIECVPGDNVHLITQLQASRCGALLGTGFTIAGDAFIAPVTDAGRFPFHKASSLDIDPGEVRARGAWFSSRTSQAYLIQVAKPGRGRIEWNGSESEPVLTSTFDFPLGRLACTFDGETWWTTEALPQGSPVALRQSEGPGGWNAVSDPLGEAFPESMAERIRGLGQRHRHFIALAEKTGKDGPAIATHGAIRWDDDIVVTGPLHQP